MEWGFRAWQAKPVVAAGKQVSTAEVQMGSSSNVGLVAPRQLIADPLCCGLDNVDHIHFGKLQFKRTGIKLIDNIHKNEWNTYGRPLYNTFAVLLGFPKAP